MTKLYRRNQPEKLSRFFVTAEWYVRGWVRPTSEHIAQTPTRTGAIRKARAYKRTHPDRAVFLYDPEAGTRLALFNEGE